MKGECSGSAILRDATNKDSPFSAASLRVAALAATQQRRAQSDASHNIAGARRCGSATTASRTSTAITAGLDAAAGAVPFIHGLLSSLSHGEGHAGRQGKAATLLRCRW